MLPTVLPSELLLLRVPEALSGDVCGRSDALVVCADRPTDRTLTPDDFRPTERWLYDFRTNAVNSDGRRPRFRA